MVVLGDPSFDIQDTTARQEREDDLWITEAGAESGPSSDSGSISVTGPVISPQATFSIPISDASDYAPLPRYLNRPSTNSVRPASRLRERERPPSRSSRDEYSRPHRHDDSDLLQAMEKLRQENDALQLENMKLSGYSMAAEGDTEWPILYRVRCPDHRDVATYLDKPVLLDDQVTGHRHWDARRRLASESSWERTQKAEFVVYLEYDCFSARRPRKPQDDDASEPGPGPAREEVHILSRALQDLVDDILRSSEGLRIFEQEGILSSGTLMAPYDFYYHHKDAIIEFSETERQADTVGADRLLKYLQTSVESISAVTEPMFRAGNVTASQLKCLFKPGDLLCLKEGTETVARRQQSVLVPVGAPNLFGRSRQAMLTLSCRISSITFDGEFRVDDEAGTVDIDIRADDTPVSIQTLGIRPLKYITEPESEILVKRGTKFYSCRNGKFVTYGGKMDDAEEMTDTRFMVDVKAYRLLHEKKGDATDRRAKIDRRQMEANAKDPDFLTSLPPFIQGFNMAEKQWVQLRVQDIRDVDWNKSAFDNLVIADETKELIQAVVRNQIGRDGGIDFVKNKGTGLIVLLHGGPGTGKTLTAESVAEIAEKSLYRVTCGDIGTNAVEVERYLESVFYLGRRWGCVVLLDEADVFLEQRSLQNLERNALVSVFLRSIEYYDGILVLTSNRVGTFDEAFKSRIQLALHYSDLSPSQRRQIWTNFITRLETLSESMHVSSIRQNIDKLAVFDMNGRQIRNCITTARQLARFRGTPMGYKELEHVIRVSNQFEEYILKVNDGVSHSVIAREEQWR